MRTTARRVISSLFALMLLSTAGLSQVMGPPRVARSVATAPLDPEEQDFTAAAARHEPIELSVREDVRAHCSRFVLPPEPYEIESRPGAGADLQALAGLGACLSQGPLAAEQLDLIGPSELADEARVLLHGLGVPFERMVAHDVPLDPLSSPHAAPRVVLGLD